MFYFNRGQHSASSNHSLLSRGKALPFLQVLSALVNGRKIQPVLASAAGTFSRFSVCSLLCNAEGCLLSRSECFCTFIHKAHILPGNILQWLNPRYKVCRFHNQATIAHDLLLPSASTCNYQTWKPDRGASGLDGSQLQASANPD